MKRTSLIIIITAIITITLYYWGQRVHVYVFKPLTTALIIILAMQGAFKSRKKYGYLVTIGLVFCLVGDVFLMLPGKTFIKGLFSFLIAHLFFIAAFLTEGFYITWYVLLILGLTGTIIFTILLSSLNGLLWPVLFYLSVILFMAWQAIEQRVHIPAKNKTFAAIGSILFLTSDSFLAFNKFHVSLPLSHLLILSTYYAAIYFLALSIHNPAVKSLNK